MKPVLTTGDVARYCHVTSTTVSRWIKRGHLTAYTTPGGHHRILLSDFTAFLERNRIPILEALSGAEAGRRVLIMGGEPQTVEMITRALRHTSDRFEIALAGDAFEAGMLLTTFRPHVVILDLATAGVDGSQICEHIRANRHRAPVRILALTGSTEAQTGRPIPPLGADGYVEKPLKAEEFLEKVGRLMAAK